MVGTDVGSVTRPGTGAVLCRREMRADWHTVGVVEIARYQVGEVALTRVPYFDVALAADVVHLTGDQIAAIEWATPHWSTADRRVLIGQAVWVVDSGGHLIVV